MTPSTLGFPPRHRSHDHTQGNGVAEVRGASQPLIRAASKDKPVAGRRPGFNGRNGGSYDLAVIGAGSAAITAADQGA